MRKPASKETFSDSVELWDTEVCFLHIQLIGTNVRLPKIHRILPRLIWNLQGLQQSLSLGTIPIDSAVPHYTHGNIVGKHMCDDCKRSNVLRVCHMLGSILWLLVQVCFQTKECQAYQTVPCRSIPRQFMIILWTILRSCPVSSFLKWWSSKHGVETFTIAEPLYLPVRNIFPRTSSHDLPCHEIKRLFFAWSFSTK